MGFTICGVYVCNTLNIEDSLKTQIKNIDYKIRLLYEYDIHFLQNMDEINEDLDRRLKISDYLCVIQLLENITDVTDKRMDGPTQSL
jgi:hypothetical protein